MLAVNSVVRYDSSGGEPGQRLVILWISSDGSGGWCLDLADPKSMPQEFVCQDLEQDLIDGSAELDAPNFHSDSRELSSKEITARDKRWAALSGAVTSEPEIYEPTHRSALYRRIAKIGAVSLNTVRSLVQLYWRGGKTKAALAPRFKSRGAPGILREPGEKKLGRPRAEGREFLGLNLTRSEKRAILSVSRAEYRRLGKRRISTCYRRWLDLYFHEDGFNEKGQPARVPKGEYALTGLPTLEQFKRVYYLLTDLIESMRKRNPREFALKYRPLTGTATAETWGPGSRFLIDATMADIYLVSRDNRNRKVGRPVIYVVIDVWSRLIVGIYVAIEDASWTSAMMALANAAGSKVAFCAEHGIEISEEDWPAANIGARLLSDHGEVDSKVAENLALYFNRVLEAAGVGRGDLKGLIETQFNTIQVQFGEFVPGYVAKDFGTRGGRDYRLDAILDIHEFTATIIDLVLERNSKTLTRYDRDQGMPGDVVKLAPIELYHWGLRHRSGRSQAWPEEYVRFRLMPTAEVSVDRNGISFQGRSYIGPSVLRLMTKARMGQSEKVTISFDPRVSDTVYLHVPGAEHGFEVCELHPNSRAYAGRTCVEAHQDWQLMGAARRDAETAEATRSINTSRRLEKRVKDAKARKGPDPDTPRSHQVGGIRANRRAEKERTKRSEGEAFRPRAAVGMEGKVIAFPSPALDDFSETNLSDFMGD